MLKSTSKKGFTLVEVLCSLGVFSIIFICMMSFELASLNMKKDIKTINNNISIMENLKNNIIYTMTFKELEQLNTDKKFYINKENMTFDKTKIGEMDVFSKQEPVEIPYIKCSFIKDNLGVYKVSLLLYAEEPNDISKLKCNFYKGDHK